MNKTSDKYVIYLTFIYCGCVFFCFFVCLIGILNSVRREVDNFSNALKHWIASMFSRVKCVLKPADERLRHR